MSRFSIRNPYFVVVICLALVVIGVTSLARMPVDLFPAINIPEVVVATFYSGMPPEDIEVDITNPLERFFPVASGGDHSESRCHVALLDSQPLLRRSHLPGAGSHWRDQPMTT